MHPETGKEKKKTCHTGHKYSQNDKSYKKKSQKKVFPFVYIALGSMGQSQYGPQSLPLIPMDFYSDFQFRVLIYLWFVVLSGLDNNFHPTEAFVFYRKNKAFSSLILIQHFTVKVWTERTLNQG